MIVGLCLLSVVSTCFGDGGIEKRSTILVGSPLIEDRLVKEMSDEFLDLQRQRKYAEAAAKMREYIAGYPQNAKVCIVAHYYLAHSLMSSGYISPHQDEQRKLYAESLSELQMAEGMVLKEREIDARDCFAHLVRELLPIWRSRLLVYSEDEAKRKEGLACARQLLQQNPNPEIKQFCVVTILQHASQTKRDNAQVMKELEVISEKHRGSDAAAFAAYKLGELFIRDGEFVKAENLMREMEREYSQTDFATYLKRSLESAKQRDALKNQKH